ncbi:histone deacetylase family protein [Methylocystis sp. H62]|uniref:histone deacetylase family protein n=1 Tax=Methylocystis sp. H62 TaxID=2785789 RepID=UPI0018C29C59|nr:histone deacetylase family protein [Methylocystis sp. H62]MBG0795325.1 histone deacetylase family protein [Methylocystis sp. H62]
MARKSYDAAFTRRAAIAGAGASLAGFRARAATASTLLVTHRAALAHDMGPAHVERPERLRAVLRALDDPRFAGLMRAEAPLAAQETLLRAHSFEHLAHLAQSAPAEGYAHIGPDIVMNGATHEAALRAAGGALAAVDAVMRGDAKNAFVTMRPPGHHATRDAPMGFCFFNNAAVAALRARAAHGASRIAIVDFDVHHGNGVQEIFWSDRNVLYASTHQMPLYPGTGAVSETGAHDTIVNAPLAKGDGGAQFREALASRILPRVEAFSPDLIILCAGFDAHLHDPLGGLRFVDEDFRDVTLRVMEIAARRCKGRIVSLLEGGYRPEDLARSAAAHVGALMEA